MNDSLDKPPRALLVGFFSTVGDIDCLHIVQRWLTNAGIAFETAPYASAIHAKMPGSKDLRHVDAEDYTHLIVICGPCWSEHYHKKKFGLDRFAHCRRIGVNLTMVDQLVSWNPFHVLYERDSDRLVRPDLSFLEDWQNVPVVARCLISRQDEYGNRQRHQQATQFINEAIQSMGVASMDVDTRWCHPDNPPGQKTPDAVASVLARADYLMTTRLHGLVFGLRAGIPVIAVDPILGGDKVSSQAKVLGWPCVSKVEDLTADWLQRSMQWCLSTEAREAVTNSLSRASRELIGIEQDFLSAVNAPKLEREESIVMPPPRAWWQRLGKRS